MHANVPYTTTGRTVRTDIRFEKKVRRNLSVFAFCAEPSRVALDLSYATCTGGRANMGRAGTRLDKYRRIEGTP